MTRRWQANDDYKDDLIRQRMAQQPRVMPDGLCDTGKAKWKVAYTGRMTRSERDNAIFGWRYHQRNCNTCRMVQS